MTSKKGSMRLSRVLPLVVLVTGLTACGGNGGDGSDTEGGDQGAAPSETDSLAG